MKHVKKNKVPDCQCKELPSGFTTLLKIWDPSSGSKLTRNFDPLKHPLIHTKVGIGAMLLYYCIINNIEEYPGIGGGILGGMLGSIFMSFQQNFKLPFIRLGARPEIVLISIEDLLPIFGEFKAIYNIDPNYIEPETIKEFLLKNN